MKIKMYLPFKKLLFTFIFNVTLFSILIISIQNSSNKRKVNLIINETVNLPISFIIGTSFISGSTMAGVLTLLNKKTSS